MTGQIIKHDYSVIESTGQIPLCMIGDSITWAEFGDHWRQELLKHIPNLAFIGSHTACFGYSHAGEGGNNTTRVLARMNEIPNCPYYNLLIGTNNNNVQSKEEIVPQAHATAKDIIQIVNELLTKDKVRKVFLSSLMPCYTSNPLRDICNQETNKILRTKFTDVFPEEKVIWVEYEKPVRKVKNWEEIILLHPKPEGYTLIAEITAKAISGSVDIKTYKKIDNTGVQVVNLMHANNITNCKIIPGWYILSLKVTGKNPQIRLRGQNQNLDTPLNIDVSMQTDKERIYKCFFTEANGHGYSIDHLILETEDCRVSEVLLEKMRPSRRASIYKNSKSYIDTISPIGNGELLEPDK